MARAKRERVVQSEVETTNIDGTDTAPLETSFDLNILGAHSSLQIDYFRRRNATLALIYCLKIDYFRRRSANLELIYNLEIERFGQTSALPALILFENRQF